MAKVALEKLIIEPLRDDIILPSYASEGDSGMDVCATEDIILAPQQTYLMGLGFKMEIPVHPYHDLGYRWECQVRPRSGISLRTTLRLPNSPGTIDNFYLDEVGLILRNDAPKVGYYGDVFDLKGQFVPKSELPEHLREGKYEHGSILIRKGQKVAQLVFNEVVRPLEIVVGKVDLTRSRGGGFGHTGV